MNSESGAGRLAGRVVLVTGGARGMGAAFARAFIDAGASVVLSDVLVPQGRALAAELGERAVFAPHDVTLRADWETAVATAESAFGALHVLVNNAGIYDGGPLEHYPEDRYRRVIDINQLGPFLGMQVAVPALRRAGGGAIVNISSAAGMAGFPNAIAYVASKWALRGMTKAAALELGKDRIRVNSVHPGPIATPMTAGFEAVPDQPIPRVGEAEEVARLVLFLASSDSSFCTGAEFVIDGGQITLVGTQRRLGDS